MHSALWSSLRTVLVICFLPVLVKGDASSDLAALQEEYFHWQQQTWPGYGRETGSTSFNGSLTDHSIAALDTQLAKVHQLEVKISAIDRGQLSRHRQISYDIFKDTLHTFASNYDWRHYGPLNPVNNLQGFFMDIEGEVDIVPFDSRADFDHYITRLEAWPTQINHTMSRMDKAVQLGTTNHNVSMRTVPGRIATMISVAPESSRLYVPFNATLVNLSIPDTERAALRERGLTAIRNLWGALYRAKTYIEDTYIPNTRQTYGVYGLPSGRDYYRACLKWHLSVDISPEDVHRIGLREVDRIKQLVHKVMTKQGFNGTISEYFARLKEDPRFQMHSVEEILEGYDHIIHNRTYPKLPQLFKDIPSQPVIVKPLPYDGPFGMYSAGSEDGSRPGIFYTNVMRPNDTLSFSMAALALHEAVPGHHLQAVYRSVSDLPSFQKQMFWGPSYAVPFQFPYFTAHGEGWGLYSEYLGEEMGVYADDYELMGRYGYEIFRACRLVLDTGLHYLGWSRAEAIQYLKEYTFLASALVEIEIDRYITWPGQACAYKIGELKIKELREKATKALGSKFDVREFHSLLLFNGRFSLSTMEMIINDDIASKTEASPGAGAVPHISSLSAWGIGIHLLLASLVVTILNQ